jgi:hypothetical protein
MGLGKTLAAWCVIPPRRHHLREGNHVRVDDHQDQETVDLERMRRELAASKALARPGPAHTVIADTLEAITTELARRPGSVRLADPEVRFRWM